MYLTQLLCHRKDLTQGYSLSGVKLICTLFSFFLTDYQAKAKELSLLYYLLLSEWDKWIPVYLKGIRMMWNINSLLQDLILDHWFHFSNHNRCTKSASFL